MNYEKVNRQKKAIRLSGGSKKHYKVKYKSQPATEKQKKYMKSLGIKFPANIGKKKASKFIDAALNDPQGNYPTSKKASRKQKRASRASRRSTTESCKPKTILRKQR